jgi:hypothetical protein
MLSNCYAVKVTGLSMAFCFGCLSASSWGALPESDADTAQVVSGVVDEVQKLVKVYVALKQEYAELEAEGLKLKGANHALTSKNSELLFEKESLQFQLEVLKAKPVCTWTVLAESITGSARSELETICSHSLEYEVEPIPEEQRGHDGSTREKPLAPNDPALASALVDVALALQRTKQYKEAEVYFSWALIIFQSESA